MNYLHTAYAVAAVFIILAAYFMALNRVKNDTISTLYKEIDFIIKLNYKLTRTLEAKKNILAMQDKIIAELNEEINKDVCILALSKVPLEVLDFYEKHPAFCRTTENVTLVGNGFNYEHIYIKEVPSKDRYFVIEPDAETAKVLLKKINKLGDLKREREKLQKDIEVALNNLRTYKAIGANFPEAVPHLPKIENKTICVNLEGLRKQIRS